MNYPDHENGDILRSMAENGFDFSKAHSVGFFAVLSTEEQTNIIASQYLTENKSSDKLDNIETRPFDGGGMGLIIAKSMLVNYVKFENKLQKRVSEHDGCLDGWGEMDE